MNDLVRPTSYYTGGIAASAPGGVLATIPNPPPEITRLPAGTILRGVVIGNNGKGQVLVKTDQGTLAVATKAYLPKNSEVVLQIRSSGTLLHIMIMQARAPGLAPNDSSQSPARTPGPPLGSGGGAIQTQPGPSGNLPVPASGLGARGGAVTSPGPANPLNLGQVVRAVVQGAIPPPSATAASQPGAQGVPVGNNTLADTQAGRLPRPVPGTVLPLRILSVSTPGPAPSATVSPAPGPAVSSTLGARAYAPPGPQAPSGPLPATGGSTAPVRTTLGGVATPPRPAPSTAASAGSGSPTAQAGSSPLPVAAGLTNDASAPPLRFTGLVTGATNAGRPVLSTPLGTLSLEVEARIPGGSRVALELAPGALPKTAAEPIPVATARSLAYSWPALEEALGVLTDTGTGTLQGAPKGVPQPGARLTSGMLFVMAALSGGNLGRWLGADAIQTLRASGRGALIGRLSRDLAQMGRMAETSGGTGSTASDWRLLPIPLWNEDHVHQLRLFLRQNEDRRSGGKKRDRQDPTRFILELEMSRLGEMQLDGLIRDKRFDLMMRTRGALPEKMRQEIRQIFGDANQAAGFSGDLGFQASADWHFLPIEQDVSSGEPPGLLV